MPVPYADLKDPQTLNQYSYVRNILGPPRRRDVFLKILEEVRRKVDFVVWGYVAIHPTHETTCVGDPSNA